MGFFLSGRICGAKWGRGSSSLVCTTNHFFFPHGLKGAPMKYRLFVLTIVLSFILTACVPEVPEWEVPAVCRHYDQYSVDFESCLKDPNAYEIIWDARLKNAQATAQAQANSGPTSTPWPTQQLPELSTEIIRCDTIVSGDSIGSSVEAAWGGFPLYSYNGIAMQVAIYTKDEGPQIYILQDLFDATSENFVVSPTLYEGDTICVSLNKNLLEAYQP